MESPTVDVAVVILTCDQKDVTLRCLSSFDDVDQDGVEVLVWDNGSSDGTVAAIAKQFPGVATRHSDRNLGAAKGRNAGARAAMDLWDPEFLLFLDNDTVVTTEFIQSLRAPFNEISNLGITTPRILLLDNPERIDAAGGCHVHFHLAQTPAVGHGEVDRGQYDVRRECVPGACCMLVRAGVFEAVGGFDPGYNPYAFADLDLSLRVKEAGYRCIYIPRAIIYHSPTQTFEGGEYSPKYARQKAKNWHRFVQRHASPVEKAGFWLIGVPVRLLGAFVREARRENLESVAGLLSGGWNTVFGSSDQR